MRGDVHGAVWPADSAGLEAEQRALAASLPPATFTYRVGGLVAGCFVCFAGTGEQELAYGGAALTRDRQSLGSALVVEPTRHPYAAGMLALREGGVLERAVRALPVWPGCLVVNATGLDHPRGAGLAVQLGAVLDLPTVGVTHRPLLAAGDWPAPERGEAAPLMLDGRVVGLWVCTRTGTRPVVAHAAWRTSADAAAAVLLDTTRRARTPEPVRRAREAARRARGRGARRGEVRIESVDA